MAIYVVVPLGENTENLRQGVEAFPQEFVYSLQGGHGWLVKFSGTSKELCSRLGIPIQKSQFKEDSPTALVTLLSDHYGFAPGEVWEWIRARSEAWV